jgi:hypothetical protein
VGWLGHGVEREEGTKKGALSQVDVLKIAESLRFWESPSAVFCLTVIHLMTARSDVTKPSEHVHMAIRGYELLAAFKYTGFQHQCMSTCPPLTDTLSVVPCAKDTCSTRHAKTMSSKFMTKNTCARPIVSPHQGCWHEFLNAYSFQVHTQHLSRTLTALP